MVTETVHNEGVRHEIRDAHIPALAAFGAAIIFSVAIVMIFCLLLFKFYTHVLPVGPAATPFASSRPLPPEPRLQPAPRLDLLGYLKDEQSALSSYGWVDRTNGVVHIPIDRAMQLLLQQGLPVRIPSSSQLNATASAHQSLRSRPEKIHARHATQAQAPISRSRIFADNEKRP